MKTDRKPQRAFLSRYNAVTRDALQRLRALDAPKQDREAVDDVLSAIEGSVAAVDKRVAALRARDLPTQSEAQQDFERSYGDVGASAGRRANAPLPLAFVGTYRWAACPPL